MINRQRYGYFGNVHIAHDTTSGNIKLTVVVLRCCQQRIPTIRISILDSRLQDFVVGNCHRSGDENIFIFHLLYLFLISGVNLGLMLLVILIGNQRIQGQAQGQQKNQYSRRNGHCFCTHNALLAEAAPEVFSPPGLHFVTD